MIVAAKLGGQTDTNMEIRVPMLSVSQYFGSCWWDMLVFFRPYCRDPEVRTPLDVTLFPLLPSPILRIHH
jgi:hypothetical protein